MTTSSSKVISGPLGSLQIESREGNITCIRFCETGEVDNTDDISHPQDRIIEICVQELQEYFLGTRKEFTFSFVPQGTDFEKTVWEEVRKIPFGNTISYEELAQRLGDVKKIRAAARANGKNPLPILIPCHRIVGKDGSLVGYAGGLHRKEWLLAHEGSISKQLSIFQPS